MADRRLESAEAKPVLQPSAISATSHLVKRRHARMDACSAHTHTHTRTHSHTHARAHMLKHYTRVCTLTHIHTLKYDRGMFLDL